MKASVKGAFLGLFKKGMSALLASMVDDKMTMGEVVEIMCEMSEAMLRGLGAWYKQVYFVNRNAVQVKDLVFASRDTALLWLKVNHLEDFVLVDADAKQ